MTAKLVNLGDFSDSLNRHESSSSSSSSADDSDLDEKFEAEKRQTSAILYEFLNDSVTKDEDFTYQHKLRIRENVNECIRQEDAGIVEESSTKTVLHLLRKHGNRFEKILKEDENLAIATKNALEEETDSGQPWIQRVANHLKDVIVEFFTPDEEGNYY